LKKAAFESVWNEEVLPAEVPEYDEAFNWLGSDPLGWNTGFFPWSNVGPYRINYQKE
jgi:hypothetical protein